MVRGKKAVKKRQDDVVKNAGIVIVFIGIVCLILFFTFGGVWSANLNFGNVSNVVKIVEGKNSNISTGLLDSSDVKQVFNSTYFNAVDFLVNNFSYDTNWLGLCPHTQTRVGDYLYVEVCDDRFTSTNDLLEYLNPYFTKELSNSLIKDNFIDYNDRLYVKPYILTKDDSYKGFDNFTVKFISNNKALYNVTSKYSYEKCTSVCDEFYKEHAFEISFEDGLWKVSKIELPY